MRNVWMLLVMFGFLFAAIFCKGIGHCADANDAPSRETENIERTKKMMFEYEINAMSETVKHENIFTSIWVYAAVREDDLSLCDNAKDKDTCLKQAKALLVFRKIAEGTCDPTSKFSRMFCEALTHNECDNFPNQSSRDFCNGYTKGDLVLLKRGDTSPDFCGTDCKWNEEDARENMAIYQGYKYMRSMMACEKYSSGLKEARAYICDVLFSTQETPEIIDAVAKDMAYARMAKIKGQRDLCKNIKNIKMRKVCQAQ